MLTCTESLPIRQVQQMGHTFDVVNVPAKWAVSVVRDQETKVERAVLLCPMHGAGIAPEVKP